MRTKLCYVASDVGLSRLLEENIRYIDRDRYDLTTFFLGDNRPKEIDNLITDGFDVRYMEHRGKRSIPLTLCRLYRMFGEIEPDVVHTHLFHSSLTGLTAALLRRVRKRVVTRHHSVEAHRYHPHAVLYDRFFNSIATDIVAITDIVAEVLIEQEGVERSKVSVVHHGFDMRRFDLALSDNSDLRAKYGLEGCHPVVGVISRFIHWKGIQYIIPAFKSLLNRYPNAKLVMANAAGPYGPEVMRMLEDLRPDRYCLIQFEREVERLYRSFDVFVHVPIGREYEAFGQVYVEALALKVPAVFTLSGIANDFVRHRENALVVPFQDPESISEAIIEIVEDEQLRVSLTSTGRREVEQMFAIRKMIANLDEVYGQA